MSLASTSITPSWCASVAGWLLNCLWQVSRRATALARSLPPRVELSCVVCASPVPADAGFASHSGAR